MWPKGHTVWTHVCVLGFFFFFKLQHIMGGGMKVEMAETENKKGGDPLQCRRNKTRRAERESE